MYRGSVYMMVVGYIIVYTDRWGGGIINLVILLDILGIVVYLLQTKGGWRI